MNEIIVRMKSQEVDGEIEISIGMRSTVRIHPDNKSHMHGIFKELIVGVDRERFIEILQMGTTSEEIRTLSHDLKDSMHYRILVDGIYRAVGFDGTIYERCLEDFTAFEPMDKVFLNTTSFGVTVLGAEPIDHQDPDRVYHGCYTSTGESVCFRYGEVEVLVRNDEEYHKCGFERSLS